MRLLLVSFAALLGACGSTTEPHVPAAVQLNASTVELTAIGDTFRLSGIVTDQQGGEVEAPVSWSSSDPGIASVDEGGLVTAAGQGEAHVTATAGAVTTSATILVTQLPRYLRKLSGDAQTGPAGSTLPLPLGVAVLDAREHPIPNVRVEFTVAPEGGHAASPSVTTGPNGEAATAITLGTTAGLYAVRAVLVGNSLAANFTATATAGPPAAVSAYAGTDQSAPEGSPVATPPAVRVLDAHGNPVPDVPVTFAVAAGGGSITGAAPTTNAGGIAAVGSWTLGAAGANTLTAAVTGGPVAGNPVTFTATATRVAAFDVSLRFLTEPTPSQRAAFVEAERRWERIIVGDVEDVPLRTEAEQCGPNSPALDETVDDLVILVSVEAIDGPGGVLGSAGVCFLRESPGWLPIVGLMRFDTADLAYLESIAVLEPVIMHEMGHALGYGTIWPLKQLLADPVYAGGTDPRFTGAQAISAFDGVGGSSYEGAKVPVQNTGAAGSTDSHWRESVMGNELMTPYIASGASPLSAVSVASLGDLGYTVSPAEADPYALGTAVRAFAGEHVVHLENDILSGPIHTVDRRGRVTRVPRR